MVIPKATLARALKAAIDVIRSDLGITGDGFKAFWSAPNIQQFKTLFQSYADYEEVIRDVVPI